MAKRIPITADYVRSRIDYDPETGIFTWRARTVRVQQDKTWNSRFAGKVAGKRDAKGYRVITLDYRGYRGHRLAWLLAHGEWPDADIDHADQDKANDRLANLRHATKKQNRWNEGLRRNNTSGFKGVYLNKPLKKWQAFITIDGKPKYLGIFAKVEDAALARDRAAVALRGEFASLNFKT